MTEKKNTCPIMITLEMISGKWKLNIIKVLLTHEMLRFGEMQRALPQVSRKVLTQQLRELEQDGIIHRTDFYENPPHVEYSLTKLGISMVTIFKAIRQWGMYHLLNDTTNEVECLECNECKTKLYGC